METDEPVENELPLFQVGNQCSCTITVHIMMNGKFIKFKIDTGAAVSVISHENQQKLFPEAIIKETAIKLRTYTGEAINIRGEMDVHVNYNMQESNLALTVVAG